MPENGQYDHLVLMLVKDRTPFRQYVGVFRNRRFHRKEIGRLKTFPTIGLCKTRLLNAFTCRSNISERRRLHRRTGRADFTLIDPAFALAQTWPSASRSAFPPWLRPLPFCVHHLTQLSGRRA